MSEATLRERRRGPQVGDQLEEKEVVKSTSSTFSTLIWIPATITLALLIFQFRAFFAVILEPWIEFSETSLPGASPQLVADFSADIPKRDAIVEAFKHSWLAYERDAMGDDEYHPISQTGSNLSSVGGIGYTVVDSLDTMLIMGLNDEATRAREWVEKKLSFDRNDSFNTFETTIRVLGGLLSAYHLSSEDPLYLEKAVELADRMLPVFNTPSGLPLSMINLARREGVADRDNQNLVSTAEVATLQLEFKYLSFLTDEDIYWKHSENVMRVIRTNMPTPKLAAIFMNPDEGHFVTSDIRLGSRGDSYYEYLLKQYLQTAGKEDVYSEMYAESIQAIHDHLVQTSMTNHLTYTSELIPERKPNTDLSWRLLPKQDHLVCFLGGSLMLGAVTTGSLVETVSIPPKPKELTKEGKRDWKTGVDLTRTCMETHKTATGLAPEIVHFRIASDNMGVGSMAPADWYIKGARLGAPPPLDARYILRPETVESLFIAFRLTGNNYYRQQGWNIFQAIQKHCRVETGGYASVINVDELPVRHQDKMETFWMSETLKYLYLLFSDNNVLPLSEFVFNTEAHPLPIFTPTIRTGFS